MYRVLVVDDDKDIADLLEMYLTNENYTVYKFYDASHALEKIDEITFPQLISIACIYKQMDIIL